MKKITFTIFALLLCSIGYVKAQALDTIPNGDFERWTGLGKAKEKPQGWDTLAGVSYPAPDVSYLKDGHYIDRPVYDGKYALSLTADLRGANLFLGRIYTKFGMKHRDPYVSINMAYLQGTDGTKPQFPLFVFVFWNSTTHDTVVKQASTLANYLQVNDTVEPWSTISFAMNYTTGDNTVPDSGEIVLEEAGNAVFTPATALYIEKMWFDNQVEDPAGISPFAPDKNKVEAYPNPFTSKTTIQYNLTQSGDVNLAVYDMQGREIKTLVNSNQPAGSYKEVFDGNGLSKGMYMYRLQTSSGVQTGKLILAR